MKKLVLLFLMGVVLLSGCGVSNETAEAIALKTLGEGGKILYAEHVFEKTPAPTVHIFIGKDREGALHYIRTAGEKIVVNDPIIEG